MNKYKIVNILLYLLLIYQAALIFIGLIEFHFNIDLQDMLFIASFLVIYMYILIYHAKDASAQYFSFERKLYMIDDVEINNPESLLKAYLRRRTIYFILSMLFSMVAIVFAIVYIAEHIFTLYTFFLSIYSVSAFIIFLFTVIVGIKIIVDHVKKFKHEAGNKHFTFKILILQNFLISVLILKLVSSIRP